MRLHRWSLSLIALAGVPMWAQAPMALTLAQAEQLAVQNNPQVAGARFNAAAAHQTPNEIKSALLPSATGSLTGVGADSGSRLAAGGLNNPVLYNRVGSGLTVSQLLTDFGRTRGLEQTADLRAQAQDQVAETSRADVLVATARAYFGLLRAQAVLKVSEETVSNRQTLADQVRALFNSQLKSQLDVTFAEVNLADARLLLSQSQNNIRSAEAELATALGLPAQTQFTLTEEAIPPALPPQPDSLIQAALQDRPELKSLRLEQTAAERFIRAEHALWYPTIAAAGAAGFAPAGDPAVPGRYGAIGVNVNIPVLNGGLFRARQNEAELRAKAAAERVTDMANRVTRDVRVAYLNASTAFERLELTAQLLQQAQLALDLARGRYDLGLSSIAELSQAQLNLTSAQIASTSARYDYQALRSVLDYQAGALR